MDKITNCPNNTFDCGVACGIYIMTEAILQTLRKINEKDKQVECICKFSKDLQSDVMEKHLEHMNIRYDWKKNIDKIIKEF